LRWRSKLDFWIEQLSGRALKKLDPLVVDALRLGLYQLAFTEAAPYAAVSETVDLTPKRAKGFVNAVLRRATREPLPEPSDAATRWAHPQWLFARWARNYGADAAERIARANQELSQPDVLALGSAAPPGGVASTLVPGMYRLEGSTAELDRNAFHPMDEGSAVIASIARACGGDVLDFAAAPGGKSIYMRAHGARVVANDISIARLRTLARSEGHCVVSDGRKPSFRRSFEVVLLDAPCSATGTLRKSPEIKWRLEEQDLAEFAALQRELLEQARALATRFVVYSTCSLEPEENDAVVAGFARADITSFVPEGARRWVADGVLRLTPDSGADGFTAFVLPV
jgi:16S rRNA (cytosine967-C5)-methyltransferase